jgi:hypothetical protein
MIIDRQAGTYRAPDGTLVHYELRADGELVIHAESGALSGTSVLERDLVKLSDDPLWPDGWSRNRGAVSPSD